MSAQASNDHPTGSTPPALDQVLGATEYFELDSTSVGARFAVWVTRSPTFDEDVAYPVLYVTDGNFSVAQTAPLAAMQGDVMLPIAPYLQVTVGYAGDDAQDWSRVRNRDLVPPGEPVAPDMRAALETAVEKGLMTREEADAYLAELADTHADAFLSFLTDELHPEIANRYRITPEGHGLFGYSYGGLFALYALFTGCSLFTAYGAGSPGVVAPDSTVLAAAEGSLDLTGKRLHLTVNEPEVTGELPIYRALARGVTVLIESLRTSGSGLALTTQVLGDTHVTGLQSSFVGFMRSCWTQST